MAFRCMSYQYIWRPRRDSNPEPTDSKFPERLFYTYIWGCELVRTSVYGGRGAYKTRFTRKLHEIARAFKEWLEGNFLQKNQLFSFFVERFNLFPK